MTLLAKEFFLAILEFTEALIIYPLNKGNIQSITTRR